MKNKSVDMLIEGAKEWGIFLEMFHVEHFQKYYALLLEWNQKMNLTAITEESEVVIKHLLDSLSVVKSGKIKGDEKIIDVGTGAGFPSIPLKIVFPKLKATLLDSSKKRITFLEEVINKLGINEIELIHGRAEDIGKDIKYREQFDLSVARAVAPLNVLLEYTLPFVQVGGYFIALKGREVEEEIKSSQKALKELKGEIEEVKQIRLPFSDILHHLIIIRKGDNCPLKYPRKANAIKRSPL
ncbi:16S rRNA (guanine(527)-N(7))-methyltransferase RsmG [Thermoanaerobacter sp. RKWS2]|uniref:16S rRNA (guanine(527)-N(7))-methyltransferase RsmG n=1 Tax=Thermoanaerobacter sp. RKWS2 TaxID=2983842 RepID=UPI00224B3C9F|nr:16S rRNA (guanine(527)-N(7))-methyltransferase RsmG [Thermoanaerobacter sp. RKWS2]UZQ83011.1 16S rRNA (guanine(527)-N(7))-methyltransferase RsmG [Thermoanaerobacter sp. RKWS2]